MVLGLGLLFVLVAKAAITWNIPSSLLKSLLIADPIFWHWLSYVADADGRLYQGRVGLLARGLDAESKASKYRECLPCLSLIGSYLRGWFSLIEDIITISFT